jgi:phosphoglucosamine mutase
MNASPDGRNINAGCGSTHLDPLRAAVLARGAALGLAFDGDADRLLAVDDRGETVDGDDLIVLFASDLAAAGALTGNTVVVTVLSNLGLRQALKAKGIDVVEVPVGDRHVADALEAGGFAVGGEQSGHLIFSRHASTGDGLLTGLKLLELVGRTGRPLGELASEAMRRVPQVLLNVAVPDPMRLSACDAVWIESGRVERELGDSGRVLLRASGTESCIRVMVEAPTQEAAESHARSIASVVEREIG